MTNEQTKALAEIYTALENMNTIIHKGDTINDNTDIIDMMEKIAVYFQDELF